MFFRKDTPMNRLSAFALAALLALGRPAAAVVGAAARRGCPARHHADANRNFERIQR